MAAAGATDQAAGTLGDRAPVGRGRWVYLPQDIAQQHGLYGVFGWAFLLLLYLFIWPIAFHVWPDIKILFYDLPRRPDEFWLVLITEAIFMIACWIACAQLRRESPRFPGVFYVAMLIGLCGTALYYGVLEQGLSREYETRIVFGVTARLVPILAWIVYVARSRRINVTIRKRVSNRDPFLRAQWMTDAAPGLRPPRGRRTGVFARPVRAVPIELREEHAASVPTVHEEIIAPAGSTRAEPPVAEETRRADAAAPVGPAGAVPAVRRPPPARVPAPPSGRLYVPRPRSGITERGIPAAAPRPIRPAHAPDPQRARRMESSLILDRLRRLSLAHDEGLITDEEMRAKRAELLREI